MYTNSSLCCFSLFNSFSFIYLLTIYSSVVYDRQPLQQKRLLQCNNDHCSSTKKQQQGQNYACYVLPTVASYALRQLKHKSDTQIDRYLCQSCFTEDILCQSCTQRVATRICLDCTKRTHQNQNQNEIQNDTQNGNQKKSVEEALYCTPCYVRFHEKGNRQRHVWSTVLEKKQMYTKEEKERRRRKTILLNEGSLKEKMMRKNMSKEEKEEDHDFEIVNDTLVPLVPSSSTSSTMNLTTRKKQTALIRIQRKTYTDPRWIGKFNREKKKNDLQQYVLCIPTYYTV
jgi:hypothetical protein